MREWKGNDMKSLKNDEDNVENGEKMRCQDTRYGLILIQQPHNVVIHRIYLGINAQTPD